MVKLSHPFNLPKFISTGAPSPGPDPKYFAPCLIAEYNPPTPAVDSDVPGKCTIDIL
jgi:hypothetical protein